VTGKPSIVDVQDSIMELLNRRYGEYLAFLDIEMTSEIIFRVQCLECTLLVKLDTTDRTISTEELYKKVKGRISRSDKTNSKGSE
jgi:hypothetical protein